MIYFDYAANTPVCEEVLQTFCTVSQDYIANPNSPYPLGLAAKERLVLRAEHPLPPGLRADQRPPRGGLHSAHQPEPPDHTGRNHRTLNGFRQLLSSICKIEGQYGKI